MSSSARGYASAPAIVVARLCRVPVLLQEQNAVPGVVNRYLARLADEVHIHFTSARRYFRRRNHLRLTGNPLRPGLLSANRQRAFKRLGLEPGRTTVFVFGGSRGAASINRAIVDAIDQLPPGLRVQFLLQTGKRDLTFVRRHVGRSPFPVVVFPFLKNVDDAYAVSDLVVCRAGAMAVSEVAACGLPSILVPYPHAAHNHQEENARDMVDRGAATMILDKELTGERLARDIVTLIGDRTARKRMAAAAHGSARYGGAEKLVEAMVQLVEGTP